MNLICINSGTYINLDALAYVKSDRSIDGKAKVRVVFSGGAETQFTGEAAYSLLMHLEAVAAEALPAPGLAVPEEEHIA